MVLIWTLETSLLRMVFGWPRISAAAAAAGPGATNRSEPETAQERLNPEFASKSTSPEHRQFSQEDRYITIKPFAAH